MSVSEQREIRKKNLILRIIIYKNYNEILCKCRAVDIIIYITIFLIIELYNLMKKIRELAVKLEKSKYVISFLLNIISTYLINDLIIDLI